MAVFREDPGMIAVFAAGSRHGANFSPAFTLLVILLVTDYLKAILSRELSEPEEANDKANDKRDKKCRLWFTYDTSSDLF